MVLCGERVAQHERKGVGKLESRIASGKIERGGVSAKALRNNTRPTKDDQRWGLEISPARETRTFVLLDNLGAEAVKLSLDDFVKDLYKLLG